MGDDDIKTVIRDFRSSVTADLEMTARRIDEMENGLLNELRSISRHLDRIDRRLENLESR